jgi:predicted acyl esterase
MLFNSIFIPALSLLFALLSHKSAAIFTHNGGEKNEDIGIHGSRKIEIMLPMRDGVKLHTLIFLPRESKDDTGTKKYTAIVDRSPYGYGDMEW